MNTVLSLIAFLAMLVFVVSWAARSLSGRMKSVAFAVWILLIALLALVVTFAAGSVSGRGEVGIGAAIIVCGPIVAWKHLAASGRIKLLVSATVGVAALVVYAVWINLPRPVAEDRLAFVGVWTAGPGFTLKIRQDGTATINQMRGGQVWEQLAIRVAPDFVETANVEFEGRRMTVMRPGYYGRFYTIDKAPFIESGRQKMVLNGIELVRE
ncbi:MAG: hypothetical protein LAQ69_46105 [Acidobacteriia bacterium]|nr:hypothetical protein [Terriglobia bacterium]